tara:strand:- start:2436 stop:2636 length:201 start_codon:yes stop_codon:yes gene_type:complete
MDPILHTIIATGLLFGSFTAGKHYGKAEGYESIIQTLLASFRADSLEIDEELDFYVTVDGQTRKVN